MSDHLHTFYFIKDPVSWLPINTDVYHLLWVHSKNKAVMLWCHNSKKY